MNHMGARANIGGLSLAVGLTIGAGVAVADARLRYDVAGGCPAEQDFLLGVVARGGRLDRLVAAAPQTLAVSVARGKAGFRGQLELEADGQAPKRREVEGSTCAEAVEALAVVAAMVLRPDPGEGA